MANDDFLKERDDGVGSVRSIAPKVVRAKRYKLTARLHQPVGGATALAYPDDAWRLVHALSSSPTGKRALTSCGAHFCTPLRAWGECA
jgi:hypothetical protein